MQLRTPHIQVGSSMAEAIEIVSRLGNARRGEPDEEGCYRVETPLFALAVYPDGETVGSVWYDDPIGRESEAGRSEKVQAYLQRYGPHANWERRLDNGWMHYWFDPTDKVQMVYGVDRDVIRFNKYSE